MIVKLNEEQHIPSHDAERLFQVCSKFVGLMFILKVTRL